MTTAGHEYDATAPGADPAPVPSRAPREVPLTLAGVSSDHAQLLLTADDGSTFTLAVTPGLRAALRLPPAPSPTPGHPRAGQMETTMDSALRPRDIQTRIRAGETAEAVAEAAQTSVEKIMPFVAPVLAERQHVAERAQRSSLRRRSGDGSGPARTLGEAAESHLQALNIDPEVIEWDAWRREDGRWTLVAGIALPVRTGTAHFTFDMRGNYVILDDEDARWLVGENVATPAPARDDLQPVRARRLTTVAPDDQELPLGDDAIELVSDTPLEAFLDEPDEEPAEAAQADSDSDSDQDVTDQTAEVAAAEHTPEEAPAEPAEEPPARRPVQKKRGRASVPSWDEIMFGGGDQ
ncbi:septation protein SepH [Nocardioides sp. GXZ039]|uniref:septation protein SepH n=1 Tax=Nocardioides sp. GXZ039 TaxID=3136018 RepID=UPI0030F46788